MQLLFINELGNNLSYSSDMNLLKSSEGHLADIRFENAEAWTDSTDSRLSNLGLNIIIVTILLAVYFTRDQYSECNP